MHTNNTKSARIHLLQKQVEVMDAQNVRLTEENVMLRLKLKRLATCERSNACIDLESKIIAIMLEDERDEINKNLEKMKKKYNRLDKAHLEKIELCQTLQDMLEKREKSSELNIKPGQQRKSQKVYAATNFVSDKTDTKNLEAHVAKLKIALDEAYDKIDELQFELESMNYLEQEYQRMQKELTALKTSQRSEYYEVANNSEYKMEYLQLENRNMRKELSALKTSQRSDYYEVAGKSAYEPPPHYENVMASAKTAADRFRQRQKLVASTNSYESFMFPDDDVTVSEIMERSALTNNRAKNTKSEASCLRSESLHRKIRPVNIVRLRDNL